jgi:GNAT superfamily N-acetyltransferase
VELIHHFLRDESYWAKGVVRSRMETSIEASLCFGVYRAGKQVGFARVVHDGARVGFLADVFVVGSERGHGIGKRLVEFVLSHPTLNGLDRVLLGTADAHSLYSRYGFEPAPPGRMMVKLQKF